MTKQWYHFDFKFFKKENGVRISIFAVDEEAARKRLAVLTRADSAFREEERWILDSATFNRDGSPIL